ncbi:DUF6476 family protein [Rhodobacter sp. Har01]|uniref:DUF6476 family protein n=1 Tax=Rhodobacter sp. Har01 TaxID=2883999 RepID=UPI001D092ABD|nr:DUF6476 family protein [Rhodobacter sp. Har01]MCB6178816.1 DUF6476 family protein [Rhodobacter sp. Har01]
MAAPEEGSLPPSLRILKGLVILLTVSMIVAVLTVVFLLVTRMPKAFTSLPKLPESVVLPAGETAEAITFGKTWFAVVTTSGRLLVYSDTGKLRQDVTPSPSED